MGKYLQLIKISFVNRLDYRQELLTNLIIAVLIFASMVIFWSAAFKGREEIKGFSYEEIIQYYIFLNIVLDIVDSQFAFQVSRDVLKGTISNLFLKPVKVKVWLISREFGELFPLLLIKSIVFVSFYLAFIGDFSIRFDGLIAMIVVLPLSYLINANLYFLLGAISFWVAEIKGLLYGLRRVSLFLSGGYIPLAFFPEVFRNILEFLPFSYVFAIPIRLLENGLHLEDIPSLGLMIVWLVVLSVAADKFFRYSYKSNESVGI